MSRTHCKKCTAILDGVHRCWCKACFSEYQRNRYKNNAQAEIERSARWNRENPQRVAENMRKCRAKDPEGARAYTRLWRNKNPERVRIYDHNKHAKRRASIKTGTLSKSQWDEIVSRHKGRCFYCDTSKEKLTKDHFVPLAKGGNHSAENIVPACLSCNCRKRDIDPSDFARKQGRLLW